MRYTLTVTRVYTYEVDASSPLRVWDHFCAHEYKGIAEETVGHIIYDNEGNELDRGGQPSLALPA